ncbi:lysylphosphatidylglycerol synthase domain-containing protein [Spirosoma sp. SC4-14]|uniref:lysylphosphatidylglycerol synthase domain-containing protein n=1 Tax=Spirosoma sp. SC4-14 TaxID=3128900 RepID=UPI0030CC1CC8
MSLKPTKKIILLGKIIVFAGLLYYINHTLRQQPLDWAILKTQLSTVSKPEYWAIALLFLIPINWGFEALKWQILLQRIEKKTFWQAYQGVLAGVSLGFALPAQLGDTAGRVLSLRNKRVEAIGASLISGGMQFYVAIVFGTIAWASYVHFVPERNTAAGQWLLGLLAVLVSLGILLGIVRRPLLKWAESRVSFRWLIQFWNVAGQYTNREIYLALLAATLRYLVFSVQFYLALRLLGIDLPVLISASAIGLVFLAKTITPAFNLLSDLGVREAASLWVFAPLNLPVPVLLTATLTLWLANVLTPVLVGLIWVWKLKITAE